MRHSVQLASSRVYITLFATLFFHLGSCGYISQPDIELTQLDVQTLEGEPIDIKDYVGTPLVVNIWETWCPPCIKELPVLNQLAKEKEGQVKFLLISGEPNEKIIQFLQKRNLSYATFLKSNKERGEYGIKYIPSTYFFDKSGKLISKYEGQLSEDELNKLVGAIL